MVNLTRGYGRQYCATWRPLDPFHPTIKSVINIRYVSMSGDCALSRINGFYRGMFLPADASIKNETEKIPWNQTLLNTGECHSQTGTVGDAVMLGHEYGGLQLESNYVLSCKVGKNCTVTTCFEAWERWREKYVEMQEDRMLNYALESKFKAGSVWWFWTKSM